MNNVAKIINEVISEFMLENNVQDDYYVLYHATDSNFFRKFNPDKAKKDERYHNPLGDGLYLSTNKENVKKYFGKNIYVYYLPKSSNIKFVTKANWDKDYDEIVLEILKELDKDYENDLSPIIKNNIKNIYKFNQAQIIMLNRLTKYLAEILKIDAYDVAEIVENIMNKRNSQYDAIWYDYGNSDEILIPPHKFNPKLFKKKS